MTVPFEIPTVWMIAAGVLRVAIAAFFVLMSWKNLTGDPGVMADFARWGYPSAFRILTAVLQIAGALLLVPSATCLFGAGLLLCILAGAVVTHAVHDPPTSLASPVVFAVLVVASLYPTRF